MRALGQCTADELPPTIGRTARERLTAQARLQLVERDTGAACYELLEPQEGRGLALLPEPSPGDVFFDIEGDPFLGEHGLEYLFGVVDHDTFTPYWATDPAAEKQAFEQLVDHLIRAWDGDPGMHAYHYAPYEPSRLKALSGRYGTRGAQVDRLLRGQRLVDLYTVVRQGPRISKESYSIKKLEAFYWGHIRAHEGVADALGSVVAFERWLDSGDQALLEDIASYNEDDCRSTEALRGWLEQRREEGGAGAVYPRPEHSDGSSSVAAGETAADVDRIAAELLAGIPDGTPDGVPDGGRDEQQRARTLLAGLLDWHRRESLPEWWEYFARLEKSDEELVADASAVGEVSNPTAARGEKQSTVWRLEFPPQDNQDGTDVGLPGSAHGQGRRHHHRDRPEQGWLEIKLATSRGAPECTSLVPTAPIPDTQHRARLRELGEWVLAHGVDSPLPQWRGPRTAAGPSPLARARRAAAPRRARRAGTVPAGRGPRARPA